MSQAAIDFLRDMGGPSVQVCIQTFPAKGGSGRAAWRYITLDDHDAWSKLKKLNDSGQGIYYLLNEGNGKGRQAKDITRVRAFAVDLDDAPKENLYKFKGFEPHFTVQTSENRYQGIWLTNRCPLDKFTPIQEAIARQLGGDPAISDLGRVLRLPGFMNTKHDPPFPVEVVERVNKPMYGYTEIISGLHLTLQPPKVNNAEFFDDAQTIGKGRRHKFLAWFAYRLRGLGTSGETLYQAVIAENKRRCSPPVETEQEVRQIVDSAIKNVQTTDYRGQQAPMVSPGRRNLEAPRIVPVSKLLQETFPPTSWIIEDLLPAGLTILAGRPKVGKSWLGLAICLAVATGERALGVFQVNQGSTINLALEDTRKRFADRTSKLLSGRVCPDCFGFSNRWPRQNDGGMDWLAGWIKSENGKARLVVIDTLQKIRRSSGARSSEGVYERDYSDVGALQELATDHNVAIVLIHHQNKGDSQDPLDKVSGSAGVTGAADTIWTLHRETRENMECWLEITGRDISDRRYDLVWDEKTALWTFAGIKGANLKANEEEILNLLRDGKPRGPTQIGEALKKRKGNIYPYLQSLSSKGMIEQAAGQPGKYVLNPSVPKYGGVFRTGGES